MFVQLKNLRKQGSLVLLRRNCITFVSTKGSVLFTADLIVKSNGEWYEEVLETHEKIVGFQANFSAFNFINALGFIVVDCTY